MGMFVGPGNQNNYVKIATAASNGTGVQFTKEVADSVALLRKKALALPGPDFGSVPDRRRHQRDCATELLRHGRRRDRGPDERRKGSPDPVIVADRGARRRHHLNLEGPGSALPGHVGLLGNPPRRWSGPSPWPLADAAFERARATGGLVRQRREPPVPRWRRNGTESYDPSTDSWTDVAPLPANLNHIQAVEVDRSDLLHRRAGRVAKSSREHRLHLRPVDQYLRGGSADAAWAGGWWDRRSWRKDLLRWRPPRWHGRLLVR